MPLKNVLCGLLGNRTSALNDSAGFDIGDEGPQYRFHIETEVIKEILILGGDQGLAEVLRDIPVMDILTVGLLKKDTDGGLTVIIIDGTLRENDVFDNPPLYPRCSISGYLVINNKDEDAQAERANKEG